MDNTSTRVDLRSSPGDRARPATKPPARIGCYEVEGELGRGGMGVVYLARDTRLMRPVALKALPIELSAGRAARERLEREARMLAALEHPHVAAIYGIEEAGGRSFLVLQHVAGETLAARLARGPLEVDEALKVALLGAIARDRGDFDESWSHLQRARTLHAERFEKRMVARAELELAHVARLRGDLPHARELYIAAETFSRENGDARGAAQASVNLALLMKEEGDVAGARARLVSELATTLTIGSMGLVAGIVAELAWMMEGSGRPADAARLLGAVATARAAMGRRLAGIELEDYQCGIERLRQALGSEAFERAHREGAASDLSSVASALMEDTRTP